MPDYTPVETRYNGMHFRSRIEARWAVFFDVLGIEYHYEPDKFETPEGRYIPDFFLPALGWEDHATLRPLGLFFEVKGIQPEQPELRKARSVSLQAGREVAIFWGSDFRTGVLCFPGPLVHKWSSVAFTQCPLCGRFGLSYPVASDQSPSETEAEAKERERCIENNWQDGSPLFFPFSHFCFKECDIAKSYNILSYFNQDYLTPARSPMLDLALETAKSMRFEQPSSGDIVKTASLCARRLFETGVFCFPEQQARITARALEWAAVKSEFMCYDEPWYVEHKRNLESGVSPCTCYSCIWNREHARAK